MSEAAKVGDIFSSPCSAAKMRSTNITSALARKRQLRQNLGHFNVEIKDPALVLRANRVLVRPFVEEYKVNGRSIYLLRKAA